jgi:hypothetical protein
LDSLIINGGASLKGQVKISGAKNAVLPIMAASILSSSEVVLSEVPDLEDIKVMSEALSILGARVKRESDSLIIDSRNIRSCEIPEEISRKMRASNLVMGALLARFGTAKVAYSGGCAIGSRPVDLHLKGFNNTVNLFGQFTVSYSGIGILFMNKCFATWEKGSCRYHWKRHITTSTNYYLGPETLNYAPSLKYTTGKFDQGGRGLKEGRTIQPGNIHRNEIQSSLGHDFAFQSLLGTYI